MVFAFDGDSTISNFIDFYLKWALINLNAVNKTFACYFLNIRLLKLCQEITPLEEEAQSIEKKIVCHGSKSL
jgi:hypothetical protein